MLVQSWECTPVKRWYKEVEIIAYDSIIWYYQDMMYKPPFKLTQKIFNLSQEIALELGKLEGERIDLPPVRLRKKNSIRTIQKSLQIEGNTLTLEQVTDIFEGKRVVAPEKDIIEVKNAIEVYKRFGFLRPKYIDDLLLAHAILMKDLSKDAGSWRKGSVGIFKGNKIAHMPPKADRVAALMEDLFSFLKEDLETSWLLKACIFHYELEFIHPFDDGNGRMGRLWQQLLLANEHPVFQYIPVEELIRDNQELYYKTLQECDHAGDSTGFIEFSLGLIIKSLNNYSALTQSKLNDSQSRLSYAFLKIDDEWFSRKDYLSIHKMISTATASRDLECGLDQKFLIKKGYKNQTLYKFI